MGDPLNSCCSCKLTSNAILRALFKYLTFTKCCGIFLSEEAHFGGLYWWSCVSLFMPPKTFLFISWQIIQYKMKLALHAYFIFCRMTDNMASMYQMSQDGQPRWVLPFLPLHVPLIKSAAIQTDSSRYVREHENSPGKNLDLVPTESHGTEYPTHKTIPASIVSSWVTVL